MFTGIVEELGRIDTIDDGRVRIAARDVLADAALGDSIAVNGCCLTVVDRGDGWWCADVSPETLSRTSLARVAVGAPVNLERSVRADSRLGGHVVQGHVDGVGEIVDPVPDLRVRIPGELLRYVVEKGSVTVDGVSLTVVEPLDDGFTVAVIPHTAAVTTLGTKRPGDLVNIEVDVMAKYVERLVAPYVPTTISPAAPPIQPTASPLEPTTPPIQPTAPPFQSMASPIPDAASNREEH
jgi:riboflavin synthase